MIVERELASGPYTVTHEQIRESLRAKNFVAVRKIPGGPAAEVLEPEIQRAREQLAADERWLNETKAKWESARAQMRQESDSLLRRADGR
jgi:argininosuccinate lyase